MDATTEESTTRPTAYFDALLERIRQGQDEARDELIRDAYPRFLRLTRLILRGEFGDSVRGQTDHVCSLSHEKFARILQEGLRRPFANFMELMGYLGTIIRRTAIDEVRRALGPVRQVQFPGTPIPADHGPDVETRLRFHEMIEGLPEDEQRLLNLKYLYQYNDTEIAQAMGVARATVGRKFVAAMLRLKGDFDAPDPGPSA